MDNFQALLLEPEDISLVENKHFVSGEDQAKEPKQRVSQGEIQHVHVAVSQPMKSSKPKNEHVMVEKINMKPQSSQNFWHRSIPKCTSATRRQESNFY